METVRELQEKWNSDFVTILETLCIEKQKLFRLRIEYHNQELIEELSLHRFYESAPEDFEYAFHHNFLRIVMNNTYQVISDNTFIIRDGTSDDLELVLRYGHGNKCGITEVDIRLIQELKKKSMLKNNCYSL